MPQSLLIRGSAPTLPAAVDFGERLMSSSFGECFHTLMISLSARGNEKGWHDKQVADRHQLKTSSIKKEGQSEPRTRRRRAPPTQPRYRFRGCLSAWAPGRCSKKALHKVPP